MSAAASYHDSRSITRKGGPAAKIATESADDAGVGVLLRAGDDVLWVVELRLLRVVPRRRRVPRQLGSGLRLLVAAALLLARVVLLLLRPRADGDDLCGRPVVPAELGHDVDGVDQAGHRHLAVLHVHRERVDAWQQVRDRRQNSGTWTIAKIEEERELMSRGTYHGEWRRL
jgi:hypothetical protein